MTAIHKKRLTIIAILTACAMFVIGLFFVFGNKTLAKRAKSETTRAVEDIQFEIDSLTEEEVLLTEIRDLLKEKNN